MITYEDFRDKRREYAFTKSVSNNPKDQDAARKIRTQMDYDDLKKQIGSKKKPQIPANAVVESNGEEVDGKFMSYATMKAKGIKPKKSALDSVKDKIGRENIYDPKRDKPSESQKKAASAERNKRQAEKNKAFADRAKKAGYKSTQDYANVVARYGSEDNMKKGKGLGT